MPKGRADVAHSTALYNHELRGGMDEVNDCAIRSTCVVTGLPYAEVHDLYKRNGRVDRRGVMNVVVERVLMQLANRGVIKILPPPALPEIKFRYHEPSPFGWRYVNGRMTRHGGMTVSQLCKLHPKGRFLISVKGHVLSVIDGVVHDYKPGGKRQIQKLWKIEVTS